VNIDPPPYSTTEHLPLHVTAPVPTQHGVPQVTSNGSVNSTTPGPAAHDPTAVPPPPITAATFPPAAAPPPPITTAPPPTIAAPLPTAAANLPPAAVAPPATAPPPAVVPPPAAGPPPTNPKPKKSSISNSLGRAKGKAAVLFRSMRGIVVGGSPKPENPTERAWKETSNYFNNFSKRSAFAPYEETVKTIMNHTLARYDPPPPTAEDVANMPTIPHGHGSG
jgi:hypothetical protein